MARIFVQHVSQKLVEDRKMNVALIIGLTGSIGTGKSTVAKMFSELNIPVIDADRIAREVVEPGKIAYEQIVATFGEEILLADGSINRKKLGSIVFQDEAKRTKLNEIVHPEVRKEMLRQKEAYIKNGASCVVLDIPLLYESKLTYLVDKILVVATTPEVQLERIIARDKCSVAEAKRRMNAQIPITEKVKWADAVIDNNGTIQHTKKQLLTILKLWNVPFTI